MVINRTVKRKNNEGDLVWQKSQEIKSTGIRIKLLTQNRVENLWNNTRLLVPSSYLQH